MWVVAQVPKYCLAVGNGLHDLYQSHDALELTVSLESVLYKHSAAEQEFVSLYSKIILCS